MKNNFNNISDEMLAAYIDGNATPLECLIIDNAINDEDITEVVDIISDIQNNPELLEEKGCSESEVIEEPLNKIDQFNELKRQLNKGLDNNTIM
jgi:hypothetical protein